MKPPLFLHYILLSGLLMVAACNNVATGGNAAAKAKSVLPGQWKIVHITNDPKDDSIGGNPDDNNIIITFKEDGSGSSSSASGGSSFKWTVGESDNWLRITDNSTGQVNALSLTKMSSSSFTVRDTSAHPVQWETFQKQ